MTRFDILDSRKALANGGYYFRVIVRFLVEEEIHLATSDGEQGGPVQGYYRSYGVTARSMSEAASLLEDELLKHRPAGGEDDPLCSVEMFEMTILDPSTIDLVSDEWRTRSGVHYVSGTVSYSEDDTPPDNDPSGRDAIEEFIRGSEEE